MDSAQFGIVETFEFFGIVAAVTAAFLAKRSSVGMWVFLAAADVMWLIQATLGASYWLYFYLLVCNAAILAFGFFRAAVVLFRIIRHRIQSLDPHRLEIDQDAHQSGPLVPTDTKGMRPIGVHR